MLPQFHAIKETHVAFNMNKIIQVCIGKVGVFKIIDAVGTSIHCGYADDMFMNPSLDVLYDITRDGCNL